MASRFIIVCAARTGSTMLRQQLNSHPNISCHGEIRISNQRIIHLNGLDRNKSSNLHDLLVGIRKSDPTRFYRDIVLFPGSFLAVGLKIKYTEFTAEFIGDAKQYLAGNKDIKIIHLKRRNHLRRFVSHQLALQTGINLVEIGDKIPEYKKLSLTLDQCIADFENTERMEREFGELLADNPIIEAEYEKLIDPASGEIARILDFLEVPPAPLTTEMVKLGRQNLAEVIENYDDLARQAEHTRYAHFFEKCGETGV